LRPQRRETAASGRNPLRSRFHSCAALRHP
jgi:hypothetical protein